MLTTTQLKKLSEHKYSAEGFSISEPFMQKFWRWLVEQIPLWWAPNAITLLGLILNLGTTFILILYSPDGQQDVSIPFQNSIPKQFFDLEINQLILGILAIDHDE